MASNKNTTGFAVFLILMIGTFIGLLSLQTTIVKALANSFPGNYQVITGVLPNEWIITSRGLGPGSEDALSARDLYFDSVATSSSASIPMVKQHIKDLVRERGIGNQMVYFVNPYIAFFPLYFFLSLAVAFLGSMFLPQESGIAWVREKVNRSYGQMQWSLERQFQDHGVDFDGLRNQSDEERERIIRESTLPEVVIHELHDLVQMSRWMSGGTHNPLVPLKFYFRYRISSVYGNAIQGIVAGGAAILIFVIGLRGLKLIPPEEPSLILMSLSLEFILLFILMLTFAGTAQEERLDRVVKELEAKQRELIDEQTKAIYAIAGKSDGHDRSTREESLAEFEERKLFDEFLSLLVKEADKRSDTHGR